MANVLQNFIDGETVPLAATTTNASVAFKLVGSWNARDVMITNAGTVAAFVTFGYSGSGTAVVATIPGTTGTNRATPILPGAIMVLTKNKGRYSEDTCAAITASGSTTLYFTAGSGN